MLQLHTIKMYAHNLYITSPQQEQFNMLLHLSYLLGNNVDPSHSKPPQTALISAWGQPGRAVVHRSPCRPLQAYRVALLVPWFALTRWQLTEMGAEAGSSAAGKVR